MSIRYTLRTLKAKDVSLDSLKRHELCLTEEGKVMIRLHDDRIVDLSAAAADYAVQISNQILQQGTTLNNKITEWQRLDNKAIQTFNEIYDEVKEDKNAVEVALTEVKKVSADAYNYKVAAEKAKSDTQAIKLNVEKDKNSVEQLKRDVIDLKVTTQEKANSAISYASAAQQASANASKSEQEARKQAELSRQNEQKSLEYSNDASNAKTLAKQYRDEALHYQQLAEQAQREAGLSAQSSKKSEVNAKNSENSAKESEDSVKQSEQNVTELENSTRTKADAVIEKADIVEGKEDIIQEILLAHANIKSITNAEIDEIWAGTYIPESTGDVVDRDGVYDLAIPIPKILDLFDEG